ncbi:hypothetical protein H6503_04600 [Candidatus Woesearchaeota archaeon]|nr:hypothetical protein [Candidatus Woesearchaeota archaeon]
MKARNNIKYKFDCRTNFDISKFSEYISALSNNGFSEIELTGRRIRDNRLKRQQKECVDIIHDNGLKAVLYTGIFGAEDLTYNPEFEKYSQRDKLGNILSYRNTKKTAMMCPESDYLTEIMIPEITDVLLNSNFDEIFVDIPWIMKGGCYCSNCNGDGSVENNQNIVRNNLEIFSNVIHIADVRISVNVSAPGIYNNFSSGANIENLLGICDHYLTEWNPLRWNMPVKTIGKIVEKAKSMTDSPIYHATTCSDKGKKVYDYGTLCELFCEIYKSGAIPRVAVANIDIVGKALSDSYAKFKSLT